MAAYRLDPINPNHPSWQLSSINECVWAGAATPSAARDLVAAKTGLAMAVKPGFPPMLRSPWQDDSLTTCVLDPSRTDVPEHSVITANGHCVPEG